jgi:hypothetical protein
MLALTTVAAAFNVFVYLCPLPKDCKDDKNKNVPVQVILNSQRKPPLPRPAQSV